MGFLDRILGRSRGSAAKQEGDPDALDREDDPRGGLQSHEYRTADPRDVVEEGGTVMSGPGGAPWRVRRRTSGGRNSRTDS